MPSNNKFRSWISTVAMAALAGGVVLTGVSVPQQAFAADPPAGCVLSPTHVLFNDEKSVADNKFVTRAYTGNPTPLVDPSNANFHIRNANVGMENKTQHTFYDLAVASGYFSVMRTSNLSQGENWTEWHTADDSLRTDPAATWPTNWGPRDPSTPGIAVVRFVDSTYPAAVVDVAATLGLSFSGERPGYLVADIAPGATGTWNEKYQISRPQNNGSYGWRIFQYLTGKTCLPVPTIAAIPDVSTTQLSGTGTTVGDTITVTDDLGNPLGTATVGADLTWTLTLETPLPVTVLTVTVTETDVFGFTGVASTAPPLPSVSVGDFVWFDRNGNGIQDPGETGIEGVELSVTGPNGAVTNQHGTVITPTTTNGSGHYLFSGLPTLPAGSHYVVTLNPATIPAGYTPTVTGLGSHNGTAESGDLTTHGSSDLNLDFGFYQQIDLAIQKSLVTPGKILAGSTVEFSLTPKNNGPGAAVAGWSVTDALPAGLTLTAMSGDGYVCTVSTRECVANAGLAAGATGNPITVKATIANGAVGTLSNVATISAATSDVSEVTLENNSGSASFEVSAAAPPTTPSKPAPGAALSVTGAPLNPWNLAGSALLLLTGLGALLLARRRNVQN